MTYATDGALPLDTNGRQVDAVYVPAIGTVALQGVLNNTDSTGTNYAAGVVQLAAGTALAGASAMNDGIKATYSATIKGLVPAASATDIFTIVGSSTKTIRVTHIEFSATSTSATPAALDVVLLVRSAANTSGTATNPTAVPHDSNSAAATTTISAYTANPTTGTLVGNIRTSKYMPMLATQTATDFPISPQLVYDFGNRPGQGIVLRGAAQTLAVNLAAVTVTATASVDISIEWTEE